MFGTASNLSTMGVVTSDHQNIKSTPSGMPVFNLSTVPLLWYDETILQWKSTMLKDIWLRCPTLIRSILSFVTECVHIVLLLCKSAVKKCEYYVNKSERINFTMLHSSLHKVTRQKDDGLMMTKTSVVLDNKIPHS